MASGSMSLQTAWMLAAIFLALLLVSAGFLNQVALMMAWLPVLAFVAYPYMKRFTWLCHFWLGLCLGLAPAGAWVAMAADVHGWARKMEPLFRSPYATSPGCTRCGTKMRPRPRG